MMQHMNAAQSKKKNLLAKILIPSARTSKWLVLLLMVGLLGAGTMGYLKPVQQYLDSDQFAFNIASVRISLYKILETTTVIVLLLWSASFTMGVADAYLKRMRGMRATNRALVLKILQIVIYVLVFLIGLNVIGIDLTALAVFSGAIGIGLGFGLQKITSNFISGLILLFEKSVEIDDMVELADGTTGFVRQTSARYTRVEAIDGREILIPNEDFIIQRVTNWTYQHTRGRTEVRVLVGYDSDLEKVQNILLDCARAHKRCSRINPPQCYLEQFVDSGIQFLLYIWVDDVQEGRIDVRSDVQFAIWRIFKEQGISIPIPQREIHVMEQKAAGGSA